MSAYRQLAGDICLQCEQARAEVKANETICGIEDGYEYKELVAEWPRHHWRDWSDKELSRCDVKPEFYAEHRRTPLSQLGYLPCEHQKSGHRFAVEDIYYGDLVFHPKGECVECGRKENNNE